ncbi:hypothetical protein Tco_0445502 [Tanacetum coccineum]
MLFHLMVVNLRIIVPSIALRQEEPASAPAQLLAPVKATAAPQTNYNQNSQANNVTISIGGNIFNQKREVRAISTKTEVWIFYKSNFSQNQLHRPQVNQSPAFQAPVPQTARSRNPNLKKAIVAHVVAPVQSSRYRQIHSHDANRFDVIDYGLLRNSLKKFVLTIVFAEVEIPLRRLFLGLADDRIVQHIILSIDPEGDFLISRKPFDSEPTSSTSKSRTNPNYLPDVRTELSMPFWMARQQLTVIIAKVLGNQPEFCTTRFLWKNDYAPESVHGVSRYLVYQMKGGMTVLNEAPAKTLPSTLYGPNACEIKRGMNTTVSSDGFYGYFKSPYGPRDQEKRLLYLPHTERLPTVACLSAYAMLQARSNDVLPHHEQKPSCLRTIPPLSILCKKDAKARFAPMGSPLQEFDFKVIDTKGAENLAAVSSAQDWKPV